jgi:hypothetical protein
MNKASIAHKIASRILPRFGEILFAAIFAAVIGLGPRLLNVDGDLGRHIALGDYILDSGNVPTSDIFSFTKSGDPLTPHEWLSDVVFAGFNRTAGLNGVVWLTALILALSYWLVYKHSLELSNMSLLALAGTVLSAAAGSIHWLTRPHIFTILFSALWAVELDRLRLGLRRNWAVFPLIMLVWVNFHGAFLAGFAIWLAYAVGVLVDRSLRAGQLRDLLLIGPVSFLASLLNPVGLEIWKTGFGFLGSQYLVSHTAEYLPPDFHNPSFWPFLIVVVGSIFLLGLSRVRMNSTYVFLISGWTALALYSARNIPLYLVVVIPVFCNQAASLLLDFQKIGIIKRLIDFQGRLTRTESEIRGGVLGLGTVLIALVLLLGGTRLDFQKAGNVFSPEVFPEAAVSWMETHQVPGEGFNYFPWGGYLLYRNWPDRRVFIDGQTDFYGENLTREYERVITLQPGWREILEKYGVQWILMPVDSQMASYLITDNNWVELYRDGTASLFLKATSTR